MSKLKKNNLIDFNKTFKKVCSQTFFKNLVSHVHIQNLAVKKAGKDICVKIKKK